MLAKLLLKVHLVSLDQDINQLLKVSAKLVGTFLLFPPPPPHQKICKTVEIVPEKMEKSSIEILQILVLSKYN